MKKNSNLNPLLVITFLLIALFSALSGDAQTIKRDSNGNFIQVKDQHTDSIAATKTGKTFTGLNGEVLPIYVSVRGKYFVFRESKRTGKPYKEYLKLD